MYIFCFIYCVFAWGQFSKVLLPKVAVKNNIVNITELNSNYIYSNAHCALAVSLHTFAKYEMHCCKFLIEISSLDNPWIFVQCSDSIVIGPSTCTLYEYSMITPGLQLNLCLNLL